MHAIPIFIITFNTILIDMISYHRYNILFTNEFLKNIIL